MMVGEKVVGVITIQDYEMADAYDNSHVELLSTIASHAAIVVENARLYEDATARVALLSDLSRLSQRIASAASQGQVLDAVTEGTLGLLGARRCEIHLVGAVHSSGFGSDPKQPPQYGGSPLGFVLEIEGGPTLYHAGDTAYFSGFREIGRRLGPEVALLPIGAYNPPSFRNVHASPADATRAFMDLNSQWMVPMHYGTFRLSHEPVDEPLQLLERAAKAAGIEDRVLVLEEGVTQFF